MKKRNGKQYLAVLLSAGMALSGAVPAWGEESQPVQAQAEQTAEEQSVSAEVVNTVQKQSENAQTVENSVTDIPSSAAEVPASSAGSSDTAAADSAATQTPVKM